MDLFVLCAACLTEFANCLVVVIFLIMLLMWLEVLCWIDHVWSSKECVRHACDPSVYLDAPICFVCRKLSPDL